MDVDQKTIDQLGTRVSDARSFLHVDDKTAQLAELDAQIASPGFWDDTAHAQVVSKQAGNLRETLREYERAASLYDDAQTAFELAAEDAHPSPATKAMRAPVPGTGTTSQPPSSAAQ